PLATLRSGRGGSPGLAASSSSSCSRPRAGISDPAGSSPSGTGSSTASSRAPGMPRSARCFCTSVTNRRAPLCRRPLRRPPGPAQAPDHLRHFGLDGGALVFRPLQPLLQPVQRRAVGDQLLQAPAVLGLQPAEQLQAVLDLLAPRRVGLPAVPQAPEGFGQV